MKRPMVTVRSIGAGMYDVIVNGELAGYADQDGRNIIAVLSDLGQSVNGITVHAPRHSIVDAIASAIERSR